MTHKLGDLTPRLGDAFIAPGAIVVGDVELAKDASIWFGTVVRADMALISIGEGTNIQDACVLHTDEGLPLRIGARTTVGHRVVLHGCTVEDECLIGIGAIVLNGARIRRHSLVGAGALVTEGKEFPERSLIIGSPARALRTLTDEEVAHILESSAHYVQNANRYRATLKLSPMADGAIDGGGHRRRAP